MRSPKHLEIIKAAAQQQYLQKIDRLYRGELLSIFRWFKKKFPKRTLKRVSGMGTSFWVLDGEILDTDYPVPNRRLQLLQPLVDYDRSINDITNYSGNWIDTGDFTMEDLK